MSPPRAPNATRNSAVSRASARSCLGAISDSSEPEKHARIARNLVVRLDRLLGIYCVKPPEVQCVTVAKIFRKAPSLGAW